MGRAWPQTIPIGEQPRRCQAKNPECFMVAAHKPWDAPGLKLLQKHTYKLNIIEINVRINTESFFFHFFLMYQNFLACAVEVCVKFSIQWKV